MDRNSALTLYGIYKIEKERGRGIYPEELASFRCASRAGARPAVDALLADGMLEEHTEHGASIFNVTNKGIYGMKAYLDIKRELEAQGA